MGTYLNNLLGHISDDQGIINQHKSNMHFAFHRSFKGNLYIFFFLLERHLLKDWNKKKLA